MGHKKSDRLEIVRTAAVEYLLNAKLGRVFEERNIIDLTCIGRENSDMLVSGIFSVFHRESGEKVFNLREKHAAEFKISASGRMTIDQKYYMPNLRNIPAFPARDIQPGDTWTEKGELVIDAYSKPFKLIFDVNYRLDKFDEKDGIKTARVTYAFVIETLLTDTSIPADFPIKIIGKNDGFFFWDVKGSRIIGGDDIYRIIFFHKTGPKGVTASEFKMKIRTSSKIFAAVTPDNKEREKEKLKNEISEKSGIEVDTNEQGLVIRMGEVLFDHDSHKIRPDTREKLEKISAILKKRYPDREIIVEGHSDNTGDKEYNYRLSEKRANSVAGFLKEKTGHDKFSYKGYGADKPITDNQSKSGREQNRRVEIIIKMN